jgi:hypothetical protein
MVCALAKDADLSALAIRERIVASDVGLMSA